jgi:hypothetical protein
MQIPELKYLIDVVEAGSFTRAANKLGGDAAAPSYLEDRQSTRAACPSGNGTLCQSQNSHAFLFAPTTLLGR